MKLEFSKGPWRQVKSLVVADDNSVVCEAIAWAPLGVRKEDQDNINLISAAPELYEALEDYIKSDYSTNLCQDGVIEKCHCKKCIRLRAKKALAKARGEEVAE